MEFNELLTVIAGLTTALGGAGFIILNFSKHIGELLANRYIEKTKAEFQKQINEYQVTLDVLKQTSLRYSDRQFEHYSKLWSTLSEMKRNAENLWIRADQNNLEVFAKQLKLTKREVENSAIFIEDDHYVELMKILDHFSQYQWGKQRLIDHRSDGYFDQAEASRLIVDNGNKKLQFDKLIEQIKIDLKKQLKG